MQKKIVYWLSEDVQKVHRSKASAMESLGYSTKFFNTFSSLEAELKVRRASIIVIGDETAEMQLEQYIQKLCVLPELQGARFVLSVSRYRPKILRLASCWAFRDIIPLSIGSSEWVKRFVFATAGSAIDLDRPYPQIAVNEISAFYTPARVVWIDKTHIHIESRLRPEIGSVLSLGGNIAKMMGVKSLSLKPVERTKTNLVYRFSDGLTAKWSVPEKLRESVYGRIASLKQEHYGKRRKVFISMQNVTLRQQMVNALEPLDFVLSIALKKNSMIHEPFYFGPDVIVLEERLVLDDHLKRYIEMVKKMPISVPIFLLGQESTVKKIKDIDPLRQIFHSPTLTSDFPDLLYQIIDENEATRKTFSQDAIYLDPQSDLSLAEIRVQARLRQVHPSHVIMDLPFMVSNFALGRIDSPLIKKIVSRTPYAKITNSYKRSDEVSSSFKYRIEASLSDIFYKEHSIFAKGLLDQVRADFQQQLKSNNMEPMIEPATNESAKETPKNEKPKIEPAEKQISQNKLSDQVVASMMGESTPLVEKTQEVQKDVDGRIIETTEEEEKIAVAIAEDLTSQLIQTEQQIPEVELGKSSRATPIHIDASDYTYKQKKKSDELDGWMGELIGSKRNLQLIGVLGIIAFAMAIAWFTKVYIERDWGKDQGKVFVDSFRKYAPKAFERGIPKKDQEGERTPTEQ